MSLLKIARLGHPVIRAGSKPVSEKELRSPEIQRLIDDMIETMRDAPGVGLAAPQVYVDKRIIVIEVAGDDRRSGGGVPLTVIVNPEIINPSAEMEEGWEGCLSIPDLRGIVPRHARLEVRGLDRRGNPVHYEASGFLARVIQHEVDHLNGNVYLDRMKDMKSLTHSREFELYGLQDPRAR